MSSKTNPLKRLPVIISLIAALILGSLAWIVLIREKPSAQDPYARYKLPANFTDVDLQQMIEAMKQDAEFAPYFTILDETRQQQVRKEALELILSSRSSEDVLSSIKSLTSSIRAQSATFYYLEYGEAYLRSPDEHPQLQDIFWKFIMDEFKVTILGVFYKVHYDREFAFQWDETSVLAAQKLREIWLEQQGALEEN